ncbi:MAG: DUF2017 family protein [Actinomycetales bacterium]|nr:DUF2017 family protein [Actinomycetales bacterium]
MFNLKKSVVVLDLTEIETELLTSLVHQMLQLLHDPDEEEHTDPLAKMIGMNGPTEISDDPVLARLFPDAYRDNPEHSAEFRRFTWNDLQQRKIQHGHLVLENLKRFPGEKKLSEPEVNAWLLTLNDLRLALGTRIGLDNETELQLTNESLPPVFGVYDWLTGLQGTLIDCLAT